MVSVTHHFSPDWLPVLPQCRNPIHKAHYELFIRALDAPNVGEGAVVLVHPTCGPTQVRTDSKLRHRHKVSIPCMWPHSGAHRYQ